MGRFNKYSVVVGIERRAEKKDLLGAAELFWHSLSFATSWNDYDAEITTPRIR